jgi:hypothetical protein
MSASSKKPRRDRPIDKRDRAILMLFVTYGL